MLARTGDYAVRGRLAYRRMTKAGRTIKLVGEKAAQTLLLTGLFGLWTTGTFAQQPATDNTKMNQADRNDQSTADQQKDNRSDRELTQHIRQAILEDKSLSTYAHNVKIISQN